MLRTGSKRLAELLRAYSKLSKVRLSALVTSTAAAGYVAGSPEQIDWAGLAWLSAGTMGAAACANSLNQARNCVGPSSTSSAFMGLGDGSVTDPAPASPRAVV